MKIKSIDKEIEKIQAKTVFLRVDFNVPFQGKKITDEKKIIATLPTIRLLMRYQCKIILATHWGRPQGKEKEELSTKKLAERLNKLLKPSKNGKRKIFHSKKISGPEIKKQIEKLNPGEIIFLENLRFDPNEKKNDKKFAQNLAKLVDLYVNDAFSVSHRKHASVSAIKNYLPAFAGLLLKKEIENL